MSVSKCLLHANITSRNRVVKLYNKAVVELILVNIGTRWL